MRAIYGACCSLFLAWAMYQLFGEDMLSTVDPNVILLSFALAYAGGCAGGA